jgi:hypothetical protein
VIFPIGHGQLALEKGQLDGAIARSRRQLETLFGRIDGAKRALNSAPVASSFNGQTTAIDLSMLPVSSRTSRASTVEGSPLTIRPIVKEYPSQTGGLVDILL